MLGLGNGRRLGSVGTAVLFAAAMNSAPAIADVRLEFSDSVAAAIRDSGTGDPARVQRRLERRINESLKELGKTNADAKALHESDQTLRVVCFGDAEAVAAGLTQDFDIRLGGDEAAETAGDFDAAGKPKAKGKAIIAIDCRRLREKGFDQAAMPDGQSMYGVLLHELLHAANRDRRHPPDDLDLYRQWEKALEAAFLRARGVTTPGTAPSAPAPPADASPAPPGDPQRVRDRRFSDAATADRVRALVRQAEAATQAGDRAAFRAAIDGLIDLEQRTALDAGRFRRAQSDAADARARELEADVGSIFSIRNGLEAEFATVDGHLYRTGDDAGRVRSALAKAARAARDGDRGAYGEAIVELRRIADEISQRARDEIRQFGETRAAAERASRIEADARRTRALADQLQRDLDAKFGRAPAPPGSAAPPPAADDRPRPGAGYAFNIQPGGNVTWAPQIPAGTVITQLGVPGTEVPLVWSSGTLTGGGIRIGLDVPLTDAFLGRDWTLLMRGSYNYADGHASGAIPAGGPNVARTYFFPNPASGVTGIFYGMTGMAIDIETRTQSVGLDVLLKTPVFHGRANGWNYSVNVGVGPTYRYTQTNHVVSERNLTFDDVWSRRELDTHDHFFGARLAAGLKVESGRWHGSLNAHVAPGVVIGDARATQRNVCALCLPSDKDFMLGVQGSRTGFGVLTGIGASVGYNLTSAIRIGAFARFDYSSRQSVWRNPASPLQQPIRLGVDDAMSAAFGIRVGIRN